MKNILSIIVLLASIIIAPTASAKGPILDTTICRRCREQSKATSIGVWADKSVA